MFGHLAKDEPRISPAFVKFLARTYDLKSLADYATGPDVNITPEDAISAIANPTNNSLRSSRA
jgi:hypothetical protein